MPRLTITLSDELAEFVDEKADNDDRFSSKSEVVRHYMDRGRDADDLEDEIEHLEARRDDLRRQLYERDNVQEKVDVLANRIEEQQAAADAPFFIRWGRWVSRRWRNTDTAQNAEMDA
jgi:Arc/MetJ-type ribon-helix-helix transcriptional regulator